MSGHETFDLGPTVLQSGITLPAAHLAYRTYGRLNADRSNAILYPTSYGAQHSDVDWLVAPGRILDPERWFVVIPNQFGNGLSSSPSNLPLPFADGRWPVFTHWDNVHAQRRLLREVFGIERLAMVYGWSMGGQQALHWGALFPDEVATICAVCTSARTSPHNRVFLEGIRAALTADAAYVDGRFLAKPLRGLRAFARIYAGWAVSQTFYRREMWREAGFASYDDWILRGWEGNFLRREGEDLLSMIETWLRSDISANPVFGGDLSAALNAIEARTVLMPCDTDLYFQVADNEAEVALAPRIELRPIRSDWGHRAGNPQLSPPDEAVLRATVTELLGA